MEDEVDFILKFENKEIRMNSTRDGILLNLISTILSKENKNINDFIFFYEDEELKINRELKLEDLNKDSQEIKIKAYLASKINIKSEIKKDIKNNKEDNKEDGNGSKKEDKIRNVICPRCKRYILINIDDYKITLSKCDKGHIFPDLLLNKFYSTQKFEDNIVPSKEIDKEESNLKKIKSEADISQESAPTPLTSSKSLTMEIKNDNNNKLNYYSTKCLTHYEKYSSYCLDCNKNLCSECEMNHNLFREGKTIHKIIHFYEILSNNDELINKLKKGMEKFRLKLDKLKIELNKLTNIINNVINNYEVYYKIYNDLVINYDIETRDYHILKNLTNIKLNEVFQDIDKINEEGHYFKKFENAFEIYNKMNCQNEFLLRYLPDNSKKVRLFGSKFVANNRTKCKLIFNNQIEDLYELFMINKDLQNYINSKKGILEVKLKINKNEKLTNMSHMFKDCSCLLYLPNLSELNTFYATDMSCLFYGCKLIEKLPDISKWNTSNVTNISYMFFNCSSLLSLPDISKWNISHCADLSHLFSNCVSLTSLPDISKWNINNVTDMSYLFYYCSSLKSLPDINNWDIKNVNNISYMFSCCSSLTKIPDISVWDTSQVTDVSYLFFGCKALTEIPNISKWNSSKITNMGFMFDGLNTKLKLPRLNPNDCIII